MTQREKYFASKVAKLISDAKAEPEFIKGGIVHTFIAPAMVKPDIQQVADPITGIITSLW